MDLESINIHRIRSSYEFENPFLMKCIEEITFINLSDQDLDSIYYIIDGYRPKLEIKDLWGDNLVFYDSENTPYDYLLESFVREIARLDEDSPKNPNDVVSQDQNHSIIIRLNRKLHPNELTTLFLEYIREFNQKVPSLDTIEIPLQSSDTRYISIKIAKDYVNEIECVIFDNQGNPNLYPIPFDNEWISIKKSENFFHIIQYKQETVELLKIGIFHSLKTQDKTWFDAGLVIGLITFFINPIYGLIGNSSYLPLIISINTIAITYLIVTKGWIFTKDLEKVVRLCQNTPIKLDYPKYYLYLIFILFIEIVVILVYYLLSPIIEILPS